MDSQKPINTGDKKISLSDTNTNVTLTQFKAVIEALEAARDSLRHAQVFICSKQAMHTDGLILHDESLDGARNALATAPALLAVMEKLFSEPSEEMIEAVARAVDAASDDYGALLCEHPFIDAPASTAEVLRIETKRYAKFLAWSAILRWQKEAGVKL